MVSSKLMFGGMAVSVTAGVGGMYLLKRDSKEKYIYELIKEDPILELLTSKSGSDDNWKKSWEKYRTDNQSLEKDPWGIANWSSLKSKASQNAPDDFLNRCDSHSKRKVKDNKEALYLEVAKWCTKDNRVTASSFLSSDNKELLTSSTNKSDGTWKAAWDAYRNTYKNTNSNPWGIKEWDSKKNSDGQDAPDDFISRCDAESKALILNKEDPVYKNLVKYCTKEKSSVAA
ncbi:hypothetical protein MHC_04920 [Mycoplasma haemocanis str. Illinois]|uniref:Uncharacterized protein n=1 Tax=Mycoplasma haemocanis (strain Illinois) TaxID=1111676 RepID=H6N868_MYCHN|nr:hypothetical protein [Mycoplasma haemocanis]AEW45840.1 hypothetical protein MHC_04920 [Mycoplasma haemocanis str. Illinois]